MRDLSTRWHVGGLVVRRVAFVARQQLPQGGERVPESKTVGQHADDTQDPHSSLVRVVSGRHPGGRAAHPQTLQHRPPGKERIHG
jgi:hypothetical protein